MGIFSLITDPSTFDLMQDSKPATPSPGGVLCLLSFSGEYDPMASSVIKALPKVQCCCYKCSFFSSRELTIKRTFLMNHTGKKHSSKKQRAYGGAVCVFLQKFDVLLICRSGATPTSGFGALLPWR
jgi:hypothetical protein